MLLLRSFILCVLRLRPYHGYVYIEIHSPIECKRICSMISVLEFPWKSERRIIINVAFDLTHGLIVLDFIDINKENRFILTLFFFLSFAIIQIKRICSDCEFYIKCDFNKITLRFC